MSVPRATIHVRCRHGPARAGHAAPLCTGFILVVSVTHDWPASPCSALVPEMLVGSDGTSQRLRTRISLQEARDHHVLAMGHRHPKDEPCAVARHAQHVHGRGWLVLAGTAAGRQGRRRTLTRARENRPPSTATISLLYLYGESCIFPPHHNYYIMNESPCNLPRRKAREKNAIRITVRVDEGEAGSVCTAPAISYQINR